MVATNCDFWFSLEQKPDPQQLSRAIHLIKKLMDVLLAGEVSVTLLGEEEWEERRAPDNAIFLMHIPVEEALDPMASSPILCLFWQIVSLFREQGLGNILLSSSDPEMADVVELYSACLDMLDVMNEFQITYGPDVFSHPERVNQYWVDEGFAHRVEGGIELVCDSDDPRIQKAVERSNRAIRRLQATRK